MRPYHRLRGVSFNPREKSAFERKNCKRLWKPIGQIDTEGMLGERPLVEPPSSVTFVVCRRSQDAHSRIWVPNRDLRSRCCSTCFHRTQCMCIPGGHIASCSSCLP